MPFLCKAMRDNSEKLSRMLKSQRGETSKNAIRFLAAYASASRSPTCLLKAKWRRLPTNTFGTPGACYRILNQKIRIRKCIFRNYWKYLQSGFAFVTNLFHFFQPSINSIKRPFIGNIIYQEYTLSTSGIRSNDCAKSTLA